MGKLFEKVTPKILQSNTDERGLLNASQFGFSAWTDRGLVYIVYSYTFRIM
jgi:hypothetical protein